ncbi:hypothetical protein PIB30_068968 [Stylosanthes scabra]|uniref:Uncharacterized protein n=1 Tax=Stylosanthes scabra TaxID=79078 RepID=A0ABU6VMJ3_9FABA|nr:hypothetical protein [Stylosanthes scabra]
MPLQFHPTTSDITLKEGAMVNLLVGTHLSSYKLSLDSLIPTISPQNSQNPRYQPPHNPELLQKFANQPSVNPQAQAQPSAPSPLSSQPLPNHKGGINAVLVEIDNEGEDEAEDEEGENDWLYELLTELANSGEFDDEEEDESIEEESEEEPDEEEEESELAVEEDIDDRDKGKIFFINTLFKEKKSEEKIPIKCEDSGPCLVSYKIRGVSIPYFLCDPGACRNIMPFEVYELLDLGPLKKSREVFCIGSRNCRRRTS